MSKCRLSRAEQLFAERLLEQLEEQRAFCQELIATCRHLAVLRNQYRTTAEARARVMQTAKGFLERLEERDRQELAEMEQALEASGRAAVWPTPVEARP